MNVRAKGADVIVIAAGMHAVGEQNDVAAAFEIEPHGAAGEAEVLSASA